MQPNLAAFLARHTAIAQEHQVWGGGTLPLEAASYLSDELPPLAYITSVRALVVRGDDVLAAQEGEEWHILPGGRREGDETLAATLHREILEESGWTLADVTLLGFTHFHHLTPRRPGYHWPHPDFLQPVYLARADAFLPDAVRPHEDEPDAYTFHPMTEVLTLAVPAVERCFLDAVVHRRGRGAASLPPAPRVAPQQPPR